MIDRRTISKYREQGRAASRLGSTVEGCPYNSGWRRMEWLRGFAQQQYRQEQEAELAEKKETS